MRHKTDIFKAYDIRGKYPSEINNHIAYDVGLAAAKFFREKLKKKKIKVLVAQDIRRSSSALSQFLIDGLLDSGVQVVSSGEGTTPFFYYLLKKIKVNFGIMITASHNPPEYNGFKIRSGNLVPIGEDNGLKKIKKFFKGFAISRSQQILAGSSSGLTKGGMEVLSDHRTKYADFLAKFFDIKDIRVTIDASGGATALFLPQILDKFPGIIYKPLFFTPDGSFKNHPPDPLQPESKKLGGKFLTYGGYRFGVIFDGDGDRSVFLDEKGKFIPSEFILYLFARELSKKKRVKVVMPVNTSKGAREALDKIGIKIIPSRVGYVFVRDLMKRNNADLGAEISGHFYFKEFGYNDAAILAFLKLCELVSKTHYPLSELVKPCKSYFSTGEINFPVADRDKALARIKERYQGEGKINLLDGVIFDFSDWWFNARKSNTQPLLRMVIEAKTEVLLREKIKELEKLISRG